MPRPLSLEKRAELLRYRELIGHALEPDARAYFERLGALTDAVLEENPHS